MVRSIHTGQTPSVQRPKAPPQAAASSGPKDSVELGGSRKAGKTGKPNWMPFKEGLAHIGGRMEASVANGLGPAAEPVARAIAQILADDSPTEDLRVLADRFMAEMGLSTQFPANVMAEVNALEGPAKIDHPKIRDMTDRDWISIDNGTLNPETLKLEDDSKDIDQLNLGEQLPNGNIKIYVGIANVASTAGKETATYRHAMHNSRTVYTDDKIYPMIPEELSTDRTSLNADVNRLAMVKEYEINPETGEIVAEDMYEALVNNKAKMAYDSVNDWLQGNEDKPWPPEIVKDPIIAEQVRIQDIAARAIKKARFEGGAVSLGSRETRAKMGDNGEVLDLLPHTQTQAHELIENLMVAANGVTARYLESKSYPSFRRVVKLPEKWDKLRTLAEEYGQTLPHNASSKALNEFLQVRKEADPDRFPDLSLKVVKLIGRGEYMPHIPGEEPPGHFALAVLDYAHSTAPNRRGPDLAGQIIEMAAVRDEPIPYTAEELEELALHFSRREQDVNKVERKVNKSAAAKLLKPHIGESFEAFVSGSNKYGTFVRVIDPPTEGKIVKGGHQLEEGEKVTVTLKKVDVAKGWIDFEV